MAIIFISNMKCICIISCLPNICVQKIYYRCPLYPTKFFTPSGTVFSKFIALELLSEILRNKWCHNDVVSRHSDFTISLVIRFSEYTILCKSGGHSVGRVVMTVFKPITSQHFETNLSQNNAVSKAIKRDHWIAI